MIDPYRTPPPLRTPRRWPRWLATAAWLAFGVLVGTPVSPDRLRAEGARATSRSQNSGHVVCPAYPVRFCRERAR
jgi:hypothetical protein